MTDVPNDHGSGDTNFSGHVYDGIQEYDNPTPPWWTWIFLGTIGFSALYMLVNAITFGLLGPEPTYKRDYIQSLKAQYGQLGTVTPDAPTILRLAADDKWNKVGQSLFISNCASCHASDGSGISGVNLTDDLYINVKKVEDIADVVKVGRKNGAMPAWDNRLQPVEQVLVSAYVASLRGKNLPSVGGRPPEGEKIAPFAAGK